MSTASMSPSTKTRILAEILQDGGKTGGSYLTDGEDRFIIGSSRKADLILPDSRVSQIHAMLRLINSQIIVYDLGSAEGTFVNGKRIIEHPLSPGETFHVGQQSVRVQLLSPVSASGEELAFFWSADGKGAPDRLELIRLDHGIVREERSIQRNGRLLFGRGRRELLLNGTKPGSCFVHRKSLGERQTAELLLPHGFTAEIYDGESQLVRTETGTGTTTSFDQREKVRLLSDDKSTELLLCWQAQGRRSARSAKDQESPTLKKALGAGGALALLALTVLSYVPMKKEQLEAAILPQSSYERVSMSSAPASAPAQSEAAQEPQGQSQGGSISTNLTKMLQKHSALTADTIQQAVSLNGKESTRLNTIQNANLKSQEITQAAAGGGGVNTNALSAGLAGGSGTKGGSLRGFANGKGGSIGGAGGFGGKGFDMSLGGDEAEALGGLDKSLIAAVVQSNIGQIKHCYERQLIVDPNIFGKIVASWTIDKNGAVSLSSVKKSTMNNRTVENCITGKIKSWTFPKPKGGGQVLVSYPFLFKSLN